MIEREMNAETGQISENIELENLEEEETDNFKREWRERSARVGISRHSHHPYHHQITSNRHHRHQPQLALEHTSASNRYHQKPAKQIRNSSQRPLFHHSDTIDLTNDSPIIEEIDDTEQLPLPRPLPVKRKTSTTIESNSQRKYRQNRF